MDLEGVEFQIADIQQTDNYMSDAVPARKMFSTRNVAQDGINTTMDDKRPNTKILKKIADLKKKKKKILKG